MFVQIQKALYCDKHTRNTFGARGLKLPVAQASSTVVDIKAHCSLNVFVPELLNDCNLGNEMH